MKPYLIAFVSAALIGGMASAYTITGFKSAPAVELNIPISPDSLTKENPFSIDKLLEMRGALNPEDFNQDWTTILPDTAGRVTLKKADAKPRLFTLTTRLRSDKFCKGKLLLNTPAIADLLVNGESVAKKNTADSLPSDISSPLDLAPEADYTVQINLISTADDKVTPDFKLEFVPDKEFEDVMLLSGSEMKRRFAPVNTMTGERVNAVLLSPDGKYLITKYSQTFSADETVRRATLSETASGKVLNENIDPNAQWMPKGNSIFYSVLKNGSYDLYVMDIPSLTSRKLASKIPDNSFTFSPDGRYLFYYKAVEGDKDTGVMRRVKSPDDRIPGDRDRFYIMRYDTRDKVTVPLTYGGSSTFICDFNRDGSKMLYMSSRQTPSAYPFYLNSIIEMDMKSLSTDTIIADNGFVTSAIYSPDARQLFVVGGPQSFGEKGVNAGNHETPNAFDNQGFIYDIATGNVRAVTRDFDPSLEGTPVWNAGDGKVYFRGETGFYNYIYSLDPKSGKISRIDTEIRSVTSFSMPDDNAQWLAYYGGDFDNVGAAYLINLNTGKQRLIDNPMEPELKDIEFGRMEPWTFKSSFGDEIDGYICLPPDFNPEKKYPLIVYYYGGTSPSTASMFHLYSPQVFASRDYVVYVINPSGTTGYGQEFSSRHVNAWGKQTAEEIIEGTKKFCKDHPFVDEKKIGCIGASYGGFMTQYLQTLTDIFAAAVSHAGISNVTSYWGEGFWGYSYNSVAAAKHYPWTDPELYTRQGSLFNADKIHTPLLLLHGKLDTNVPIGESIQIFNALRVLGRDVEFITVEDENHVISNFDRKLLWQNTIMAWFAKYLQDDPRWWNELYK
ncbi:MAG: S9 family peptidase [Muribaculaceae bacterium]|nr:S9 family peptidase [Muribaculaceae bacterium]MDE6681979.1 S9 family peptidase [Muribaculaceae bacterium]